MLSLLFDTRALSQIYEQIKENWRIETKIEHEEMTNEVEKVTWMKVGGEYV